MSLDLRVRRFLCSVHMDDTHKNLLLYIAKCVAAASVIYVLSYLFHYPGIGWCLVSAVLVLSPNAEEALPVALTRIAATGRERCHFSLLAGRTSHGRHTRWPMASRSRRVFCSIS